MKSWSLNKKIWSILGMLCFAYVVSNAIGIYEMFALKASLNEITTDVVKRDQMTGDIKDNQRLITAAVYESILEADEANLVDIMKNFYDTVTKQEKDIATYEAMAPAEEKAELAEYKKAFADYMTVAKDTLELGSLGKKPEAAKRILSANNMRAKMRGHLGKLDEMTSAALANSSTAAAKSARLGIQLSLAIGAISVLIALSIAFVVLRSLSRSINEVVSSLTESSMQVGSAASQIASSSQELSSASTEQAASLEQTAAAIEELNSMVAKNSENAGASAKTSGQSQIKAAEGKQVVEKMMSSMEAINHSNEQIMKQVNQSNDSMSGIVKVIEEIGLKTKVINEIVFQTKLLSFNASVEAARAGEHGKGFAVVAEEVGNLAAMSGNAAQEISSMLEKSMSSVNQIVAETKRSVEQMIAEGKRTVEEGARVARECGDVLEEIVQNVGSVTTMAGEIAAASTEQSKGVNEITKAMAQLDQTTQKNASSSQECASAAEELSAQSNALQGAVDSLVVTIRGANGKNVNVGTLQSVEPRPKVASLSPKKPLVSSTKTTPIPSKTNNVIAFEAPKAELHKPVASRQYSSAAGDVPDRNNEGFEDV